MRLLTCLFLSACLASVAAPAGAAPAALQCGDYRSADGGMALVLTTPGTGYRQLDGQEREPLWIDRSAAQPRLLLLDDGVAQPVHISADGRTVDDGVVSYTLHTAQACAAPPTPAPGSCQAAGSDCLARFPDASTAQLQRTCDEGVGAACSALLQRMRDGTRDAGGQVDDGLQRAATDDTAALPATARGWLQQRCLQQRGGRFCTQVAEQQLIALDPALAVQALQVVCDAGRASACERIAPLRGLGADLRLVPLRQVPCGRYQTDGGVIDLLDGGGGSQARLQDGALHLQQDGETLVLRQLGNGDLLGMDTRTGYQRYQRVPGTAQCTPPREGRGSP
ncbi:TPA: hypothetical protein QDZ34_001187 [Stenotrophomonas maltophilia]|nr:hypothetical protein [Stenotrophomonas maltophilia]HDS1024491.1 hypothetical protein [Stenotrophomonas maltophilia]HDS1029223.1 hypothetical protein [Stenotrophomonas maltophilia]HDS1033856.1 hypothetical protein [Stenotrophomonas maltophilia]